MKLAILDILNFITSEHDSNSDEQTKTLLTKFDALFNQFPDMQLLSEFALKGDNSLMTEDEFDNYIVDDESFDLHKKALSLSKDKNISYKEAIVSLMALNNN